MFLKQNKYNIVFGLCIIIIIFIIISSFYIKSKKSNDNFVNYSNTNIDPITNFITLSIPSSIPSSTSVSNFKNIKKNNRSKFVDIPASYVNPAQTTRIAESVAAEAATSATEAAAATAATTTTYSGTSSTNSNPTSTNSGSMTTIPLTTYGYKINKSDLFSSPETKLYQHNFEGTSNIYSPAIYYNVENFTPLNF